MNRVRTRNRHRGFSLIELLVSIAIVALLTGVLLPSLAGARRAGRAAACLSNLRQIAAAALQYAGDQKSSLPPGASDFAQNLHRWHGSRANPAQPFRPEGGSLSDHLDAGEQGRTVRSCPTFEATMFALRDAGLGFERGCGGYGYNNAFAGVVRREAAAGTGVWELVTDRSGSPMHRFERPTDALLFADAALATNPGRGLGPVTEYSFIEPTWWPDNPGHRPDPSVHFRHGRPGVASAAWLDGHAGASALGRTASAGVYGPIPTEAAVGWPGIDDDNRLFGYR